MCFVCRGLDLPHPTARGCHWDVPAFDVVGAGTAVSRFTNRIVLTGHAPLSPFVSTPLPEDKDEEEEEVKIPVSDGASTAHLSIPLEGQQRKETAPPAALASSTSLALARTLLFFAVLLVRMMRQMRTPAHVNINRLPETWRQLMLAAGLSEADASAYAELFHAQQVRLLDVAELNYERLKDIGVTVVGHQMMIMKYIQNHL